MPPGETSPLLLLLPHLPDGVLLPPAKAIVWQVLWPGWNVLLPGETGFVLLHCDTVELPLLPREVFVWQVLGPALVPPPEEHDIGTLLLAVGSGILAIDEA